MWLIEMASDPQRNQSSSRTEIRAGELLHEPSRLFVFVGFSDDRRLALVVRFGVVVFVLVIIIVIVGVSRRHRVAHNGDESPLGRGKVLKDALGHGRLLAGCRDILARMLSRGAKVQQKGADATRRRRRGPPGGRGTTDVRTFFFASLVLIAG